MDARREMTIADTDIEPSRLWWLLSGAWVLMFGLVLMFVLLAEYTRYERLESHPHPATAQQVNAEL